MPRCPVQRSIAISILRACGTHPDADRLAAPAWIGAIPIRTEARVRFVWPAWIRKSGLNEQDRHNECGHEHHGGNFSAWHPTPVHFALPDLADALEDSIILLHPGREGSRRPGRNC